MSTKDIFCYDRNIQSAKPISAANMAIDFGLGRAILVQSVRIQYGHQVMPVHESGSNALYLVAGKPMGSMDASSLLGPSGFTTELIGSGCPACADLTTINVNLVKTGEDCKEVFGVNGGNTNMKIANVLPVSIGYQWSAGEQQVAQSASFQFGSLSHNK